MILQKNKFSIKDLFSNCDQIVTGQLIDLKMKNIFFVKYIGTGTQFNYK